MPGRNKKEALAKFWLTVFQWPTNGSSSLSLTHSCNLYLNRPSDYQNSADLMLQLPSVLEKWLLCDESE